MVTKQSKLTSDNETSSYSSEIIDGNKTEITILSKIDLSYSSEIIDGNKTPSKLFFISFIVIF